MTRHMNERTYLPLAFCSLLSITAFAQGPTAGVKVGANLSNLVGSDIDDQKGRFGLNAGLFGRTDPEQTIGLQVELLYDTKGTEVHYNGPLGIDQDVELKLAYIDLPVMASFRFGPLFEVQAGAYAGLLVSSGWATSGDVGNDAGDLDQDNFNSLDFGVLLGAAVNLGPVQIGARYDHGLTQVADSDAAETVLGDSRNAVAQLYVAFGIMQ